jgi:transcription antitermination factor NusG
MLMDSTESYVEYISPFVIHQNPASWYALLVLSGTESRCCVWLCKRQFKPYWPRYQAMTKLSRSRRDIRWRSVIPGYLFLPAVGELNWRLLRRYNPYIHGVLADAATDEWIKIPDKGENSIGRIREIEMALNSSPVAAAQGIPFRVGQRVHIENLGADATITRIDGARHITVETKMFERVIRVNLSVLEIESV